MTEEQLEGFVLECWEAVAEIAGFPSEAVGAVRQGIDRNRNLSPARRMEGLRMAARDLLTMLSELTPEQRQRVDGALYGRHQISVGKVRAAVGIDWSKVAERGLRDEEEYYAAREVCEDPAAHGVDIDPSVLSVLMQRYEEELESNVS